MFPTSNVRNLKRRADSSDTEEAPAKQARVSVQNTHIRRLPALRRSDTQALDVNASTPVLQHLPPNTEPVPAPVDPTHHRGQEQDMGGSTDEESQDEEGAWDRRAKAHRHAALFRRPREPAPRMKPRMVAQTPSEIALLEGSDSDSDTQVKKLLPTTDGAATRFRRLEALRAARTATGNAVSGSKTRGSSSVMPKPAAQVMAPPSIASSSTSTTTTTTTTTKSKSVSRASSRTTVTTTTTVAQRVEEIDSLSSSCPTRAPRARSVKLTVAPKAPVTRPQRQNSRARQDALNAIAGSSSTTTTPAPAVQRLPTTASLASQPSAVLRRSRRILSKLAAPEIE